MIDVPFEVEVTREVAPVGIRNYDELRPTLEAAVEQLYEAAAGAVVPEQRVMLDRLFDQVRAPYGDGGLANVALQVFGPSISMLVVRSAGKISPPPH